MTDLVIKAVMHGILKTSTRETFDEALRERGYKIVSTLMDEEKRDPLPGDGSEPETTWEDWCGLRSALARPGWTVCRFPVVTSRGVCNFMLGTVRDVFGVYKVEGTYRSVDHETGALKLNENADATWLVHMPTGIHMGIFDVYDMAIESANLAMRDNAWSTVTDMGSPEWSAASSTMTERLYHMGVVNDPSYTVEIKGDAGRCLPVFHRINEILEAGRPRRLS